MFNSPAVADFKNQFFRDFPYGTDQTTSVIDADITGAFVQTNAGINPCLFTDQGTYTLAYLLLSAHYLILSLRRSSQGLSGGAFQFLESSTSVGSIAQSFAIPPRILENPLLAALCTTQYGGQYLQMILPMLAGQIFAVAGTTQP